jgi:multiple sugar transport system permease protein
MIKRAGIYLSLILILSWCLSPFVWQFITSLKPDSQLTRIPPLLPQGVTLSHYRSVFEGHPFSRVILNSGIVASATTLLSVLLGSLCAYGLAKFRIRYKTIILGFILSVSILPPVATVSPLYLLIRALGLRDTWWGLILTHTTFSLPLSIWILTSYFSDIPDEVCLAAWVDGCSPFQIFSRILLPLAAPGVFSSALLVFIFSWNEFLFALTFTATSASRTIPVAIALFPGIHENPWGDIAAASIVVTMPLVVLVFIFQKRIVAGLTAGALKG